MADASGFDTQWEDTTLKLPTDTVAYLKDAAERRGVSAADMVRIAIGTQKFLADAVDGGAKVQLKRKDGTYDVSI